MTLLDVSYSALSLFCFLNVDSNSGSSFGSWGGTNADHGVHAQWYVQNRHVYCMTSMDGLTNLNPPF